MRRLQEEPELSWPARPAAGGRLRDAVSMLVRLARVLGDLHEQGVVHRDLKPENVFVGVDGRMTLLDFGLAARVRGRGADVGSPRATTVATTVEYAAPELLRGERLDERVDVYALGCILYEVVTGIRPFEASSIEELVRMHLDETPACPSDLVAGISWRLEDLILAMMAKRPKQRPRNGGEVAARLTEAFYRDAADGARVAA
jgi:serine/threonine protein kinase